MNFIKILLSLLRKSTFDHEIILLLWNVVAKESEFYMPTKQQKNTNSDSESDTSSTSSSDKTKLSLRNFYNLLLLPVRILTRTEILHLCSFRSDSALELAYSTWSSIYVSATFNPPYSSTTSTCRKQLIKESIEFIEKTIPNVDFQAENRYIFLYNLLYLMSRFLMRMIDSTNIKALNYFNVTHKKSKKKPKKNKVASESNSEEGTE